MIKDLVAIHTFKWKKQKKKHKTPSTISYKLNQRHYEIVKRIVAFNSCNIFFFFFCLNPFVVGLFYLLQSEYKVGMVKKKGVANCLIWQNP